MKSRAVSMTTIGERIYKARMTIGISQAQFSKLCGWHPSKISHLECDRRAPSVRTLVELSMHLGVCTDWILGLRWDA